MTCAAPDRLRMASADRTCAGFMALVNPMACAALMACADPMANADRLAHWHMCAHPVLALPAPIAWRGPGLCPIP